jgi:SatD family protein
MTTRYVALIADVVGSRALGSRARAALQRNVGLAAREFNARYRPHLAARFAVTLGDELQGLLSSAAPVWDISHQLRLRIPGVEWVVACGRGTLGVPLRRGASAPELDGPCYHAARLALDHAKRHDLVFTFGGFDAPLAACAAYYSALYRGWTRRQRAVATAQRARPGARLEELARLLHVGPSAISHLRRRMVWPLVAAGDSVFQELLAP